MDRLRIQVGKIPRSARNRLRATALVLAFVLPGEISAQTARLTGSIVSSDASTPLAGVSVRIIELDLEAVTTATGRFVLAGIPAGDHDVAVDLLGYTSLRLRDVGFRAGRPTELAIRLDPSPVELAPSRR